MFQVVKRDGEVADFTLVKIKGAIVKAFDATGVQYNDDIIDLLSLRVTAEFQGKVKDGQVHVDVYAIQIDYASTDMSPEALRVMEERKRLI